MIDFKRAAEWVRRKRAAEHEDWWTTITTDDIRVYAVDFYGWVR